MKMSGVVKRAAGLAMLALILCMLPVTAKAASANAAYGLSFNLARTGCETCGEGDVACSALNITDIVPGSGTGFSVTYEYTLGCGHSFRKTDVCSSFDCAQSYSDAAVCSGSNLRVTRAAGHSVSNWASNDNDATAKQTVQEKLRHITVTNVDADGKLKIQIEGAGLSALSSMISQFRNFNLSGSNNVGLPSDPKNGDFVSAKFSGDGEWYRGRIRANDRAAKEAEVQFIDFGNREKIPWSKLRPLAPQFSVQKLKAQAEDAVLSCIQMPAASEYRQQTIEDINNYTVGKKLLANIDFVDRDGTNYITLHETEDKDLMQTTNVQLVGMGLAIVKRNLRGWEMSAKELVEELREAEENAKSKRAGMWQYGDITEE